MFGVNGSELIILAFLALIFIGPKELPHAMVTVGRFVGRMRGYARHFTEGIEHAMREAELEEMERRWREQNERILAHHPADGDYPDPPAAGGQQREADRRPDASFDLGAGAAARPDEAEPSLADVAAMRPDPLPVDAPSVPLAEWEAEPPLPFDVPPAPDADPRPPSERELP